MKRVAGLAGFYSISNYGYEICLREGRGELETVCFINKF